MILLKELLLLCTLINSSIGLTVPVNTLLKSAAVALSLYGNSPTPFSSSSLQLFQPNLLSTSSIIISKDELPPLEKCFNAVRKELSEEGESLKRLSSDIASKDFKDIILFTREYDAGFRGGVLKSAWKQLGDSKMRGIQISNSFTFDLIALNKAARVDDTKEALRCLDLVKQDLIDFLALETAMQQ